MVRANSTGVVIDGKQYVEFTGLSSDPKPSGAYLTGSTFLEIDTSNVYFYDEESEAWLKAGVDNA